MMQFTQGNLLEAPAEALVNTVNTVGVMGKGIALMFKEAFADNTAAYERACRRSEVEVGRMLVTRRDSLIGPKWIINFPTKKHWRHPSRLEWIEAGLADLVRVIRDEGIRSIAVPPLGAGNGGLDWSEVRPLVEAALGGIEGLDVTVFEPTMKYQNVVRRHGVQKLTPARAMIAELVRRYAILGFECSMIEVQKLAYFLEQALERMGGENPLGFRFVEGRYGPYSDALMHVLDKLDGSYLHCDKRIADAGVMDAIRFEDSRKDVVMAYLGQAEARPYRQALEDTSALIDGFESPLGLELLATMDWMITRMGVPATVDDILARVADWPYGRGSGERKRRLFDQHLVSVGLERLALRAAAVAT